MIRSKREQVPSPLQKVLFCSKDMLTLWKWMEKLLILWTWNSLKVSNTPAAHLNSCSSSKQNSTCFLMHLVKGMISATQNPYQGKWGICKVKGPIILKASSQPLTLVIKILTDLVQKLFLACLPGKPSAEQTTNKSWEETVQIIFKVKVSFVKKGESHCSI